MKYFVGKINGMRQGAQHYAFNAQAIPLEQEYFASHTSGSRMVQSVSETLSFERGNKIRNFSYHQGFPILIILAMLSV
jgi:hypothetical protein